MKTPPTDDRATGGRYLELVREFPRRPIKAENDCRRASEIVTRLASAREGTLPADEQDYLETLSLLVEEYDARHEPPDAGLDPVDALKSLMESHDMTTTDLGRLLGSKGVASEVLNGKRSLSQAHIGRLAERFNVDVSLFFPPQRVR